jgi:GntR family transcriptional regulator, carbon starvation induced regulator
VLDKTRSDDTVGNDGYRRIRADIIFGHLQPDQKLRLETLKEDYGVSVSTLREILSRLSSEGFVIAEGRRGFEVAPVSTANLKELAELRILLECHAMERSFARGDMEWEGRVVSAHHKLAATEHQFTSGKPEAALWKRYDGEFHQALISNCGSRELMESHQMIFDKYFRYPLISADSRGLEPVRQHRQLLECAIKRDVKRAKAILTAHVNNCVAYAVASGTLR